MAQNSLADEIGFITSEIADLDLSCVQLSYVPSPNAFKIFCGNVQVMIWYPNRRLVTFKFCDFQEYNLWMVGVDPGETMRILQYTRGGYEFLEFCRQLSHE